MTDSGGVASGDDQEAAASAKTSLWRSFWRCCPRRRKSDLNSSANQAAVAVCAALASFVLVFGVILAMGFVDYQGRLTKPGVRTSDIIGSVTVQTELEAAIPVLLRAAKDYREVARKLQQKQADVNYRIDRVCSRFDVVADMTTGREPGSPSTAAAADPAATPPSSPVAAGEQCRKFLARIPFDGALVAPSIPQPEIKDKAPGARQLFEDTIVDNFVEEMNNIKGIDIDLNNFKYLYKSDFITIAENNHDLYTNIYLNNQIKIDEYLDQCAYIVTLMAQVGYQKYTMPSCNAPRVTGQATGLSVPSAESRLAGGESESNENKELNLTDLTNKSNNTPDSNQLIFDMVNQFRIYDSMSSGFSRIILLSSPETVAQLLLVIGGALGAMLKILFWHLLPARNIKWTDLIIEPAQGCVCAIILFILFRSGVVLVSGGGDKIDGSTLSPFFVAFLAIGAGLLSDEVITAFRRAAQGVIGNSAVRQPDRWAVGLAAAFEASTAQGLPISIDTLAARLGVLPERVRNWMEGDAAVDAENQTKIALVLGVPTFRIFTDIRPAKVTDAGAAPPPIAADPPEPPADPAGPVVPPPIVADPAAPADPAGPVVPPPAPPPAVP